MNSETWVSHTPETTPNEENDPEEDFASAAEPKYRPPSPPSTFEKFFLPFDKTGDTSPFALAARRITTPTTRKNQSTRSLASESIVTEDFASATENISVSSELDDISLDDSVQKSSLFNDILGKQTILEETPEEDHEMSKSKSKKTKSVPAPAAEPVKETTPEPTVTVEETETSKFDVIENVYEGAKSVWAFGKNIIVFKPFMGVAEGAAAKVLSIAAGVETLEEADKNIKSTLSGVDKDFIDPAILKLWEVLEPIVGKGDEVLKTVLGVVSKKVPMLEGGKTETTEEMTKESPEAVAPETSTPAVIA